MTGLYSNAALEKLCEGVSVGSDENFIFVKICGTLGSRSVRVIRDYVSGHDDADGGKMYVVDLFDSGYVGSELGTIINMLNNNSQKSRVSILVKESSQASDVLDLIGLSNNHFVYKNKDGLDIALSR